MRPGLGRPRVLSPLGREEAAQRWYDGENGPDAPISVAAPRTARCISCAFYVKLGGSLGRIEDPKLADVLLREYPKLARELQPLAIDLIMQRERWARKLLDAVLAKNPLPPRVAAGARP